MKNILLLLQLTFLLIFLSCNKNKVKEHSQEIAEEIENEFEEDLKKIRPSDDAVFLADFSQKELFEIELGKLSIKNTESQDIVDFTHKVILEHLQINNDLTNLAKRKGIILPDSLEIISKVKLIDLKELKGKEFDKKLIEKAIKYNKKDIKTLEKYKKKTKDKEIVEWIDHTLSILNTHLKEAQIIESKIAKE